MEPERISELWWGVFPDLPKRRLSFIDTNDLDSLYLTEAQFHYLLLEYKKDTFFPNIRMFISWVEQRLRNLDVPEDLSCRAYLSKNPTFIAMAEDLETLAGAWYPDKETNEHCDALRASLREALV